MKKFLLFVFLSPLFTKAQDFKEAQLNVDFEYRPRTELRRGYRALPSKSDNFAFFTSHRARINIDYTLKNFLLHTSLQDIRIWGDTDTRSADGKAQFYEFFVQQNFGKYFSARIGRQRVKYDNQRLFAENNWRQAGGQHDALRFMYKHDKIESDLILAFNQDKAQLFSLSYDTDWDTYRSLAAHFLNYNANKNLTLTTINFADEYVDANTANEVGYVKITNGGRIKYKSNQFLINLAGYYQWGNIETVKKHSAYYIEPEIILTPSSKYNISIGAQVFSGDSDPTDDTSTAFLAQYGAFHKYNGQMDYTAVTVTTYEHEGIMNPYINQNLNFNKKLSLNWQSHLLGATTNLKTTIDTKSISRIYAWENDLKLKYLFNNYTHIEMSYMFLKAEESIQLLNTGIEGDLSQIAHYTYIAITWTPKLYNN